MSSPEIIFFTATSTFLALMVYCREGVGLSTLMGGARGVYTHWNILGL